MDVALVSTSRKPFTADKTPRRRANRASPCATTPDVLVADYSGQQLRRADHCPPSSPAQGNGM